MRRSRARPRLKSPTTNSRALIRSKGQTVSIEALSKYTYEVRHNPNCPSPFCIVTCGATSFVERGYDKRNLHSFGKTFDEAARNAVAAIRAFERRKSDEHKHFDSLRRIGNAEWRVRDVVWA